MCNQWVVDNEERCGIEWNIMTFFVQAYIKHTRMHIELNFA